MKYLGTEPIYSKAPTPESEATWERCFGEKPDKVADQGDKVDKV